MKIQVDQIKDVTVVALDGELGVDDSIRLRDVFLKIVKEGRQHVVVDFAKVAFVGSAGLATLIEMVQQLKKTNGQLRLCNINKEVRGLFEITKIHKLISIDENREMALRAFS